MVKRRSSVSPVKYATVQEGEAVAGDCFDERIRGIMHRRKRGEGEGAQQMEMVNGELNCVRNGD